MDEITQNKIARLADIIKFPKNDMKLLEIALTHRSMGNPNNERLEFLGDSVLNFIIGAELYNKLSMANEGTLTCFRAKLVRKETLAELAEELRLGDYLILGPGERKSGGQQRGSILADAFEAIIGAVFCSAGFAAARDMVLGYYQLKLADITEQKMDKDPKTRLQELLQARKLHLPEYEVVKITGAQHDQMFYVHCTTILLSEPVEGVGISRRGAEQDAAEKVLKILTTLKSGRSS